MELWEAWTCGALHDMFDMARLVKRKLRSSQHVTTRAILGIVFGSGRLETGDWRLELETKRKRGGGLRVESGEWMDVPRSNGCSDPMRLQRGESRSGSRSRSRSREPRRRGRGGGEKRYGIRSRSRRRRSSSSSSVQNVLTSAVL